MVFTTEEVQTKALNEVNIEVKQGEFVAIMGPSGCGKSTLLNILGTLDSPTSGKYFFNGKEIDKMGESQLTAFRKGNIGFVFQSFNLIDELTVFENVELPLVYLGCRKSERKRKVMEVLDRMNIAHRAGHFPQQLSGGQQQRVAIARAVVTDCPLILADEPTTALDVTIQAQMLGLINELQKRLNTAMILITHDLGVVAQTCEKVMDMYAGEAIEYGTAEDIFETTQRHPYTQGLFNAIPKLDENTKRLEAIEGMMADPTQKIEGCRFADRCKYATAACKKAQKMREVTPGHFIRCCRFDPPQSNT